MTTTTSQSPAPIRIGLIGCGYVSKYHIASSLALKLPMTAVCDRKLEAAGAVAAKVGAKVFETPTALMNSGAVDAVIIATPHFQHAALTIEALDAGLHVLIEKPLTVSASDGAKVIDAAERHPDRVVAVNFNHRAWPLWRAIKRHLDEGAIGPVTRFSWTITDWFRTQHYYNQSSWRGTWRGEGGGLLVNQCPHQLDLLTWLLGVPDRVVADVRLGKHHDIVVEDEVHALLHYDAGLTGSFIASTGEPFGINRLEIIGDRGQMRIESETSYTLTRFAVGTREHTRINTSRSDPPELTTQTITVPEHEDEYEVVLGSFVEACAGRAEVLAPASSALRSVQLANALLISGLEQRSVTLPPDAAAFDALMARLQTDSGGLR